MRFVALLAGLALCSASSASAIDCEFDLDAVREAALAAGPVRSIEHFIASDGKTARSLTVVIDLIRPDRMRRISILENGKTGQMVVIGRSGWDGNVDRKWEPFEAAAAANMLEAVMKNSPWPASDTQTSCSLLSGEGPGIVKFSFSTAMGETTTEHEVFADRETKVPIRYRARTTQTNGTAAYTQNDRTFHFIGTLEIEAPR